LVVFAIGCFTYFKAIEHHSIELRLRHPQ